MDRDGGGRAAAPGQARRLAEGLRVVLAPNPSPLTGAGTNTYLLGQGAVAVIDPGPALPSHLDAILGALAPGERIGHILVTHAHHDHSGLARPLAARSGAPVCSFGRPDGARTPAMAALAAAGLAGGEGVDGDFAPDERIADGDEVSGDGWRLRALHTPGHLGDHLCLLWKATAFSGDHVMGWSTSLVAPPDGDMGAYMTSLDRLAAARPARLWPGHGEPVEDAPARIAELARHRRGREAQILAALADAPGIPADLARRVYRDTAPALLPAAELNVLAHLIDLLERNLVSADRRPGPGATFHRR
ncbi:MAG: MBL fold metallo-hydrolase [Paracoccaceae bacterium]